MEEQYLTVTALTKYIKYKFDCDRHLNNVLLTGEISNFKHHSRGHFYFTLKDDGAQISCMMFASYASKVLFEPKDGMKVFVKGTVTVYEAGGYYQITIKEMKSDGIGDLYLRYEALKKELGEKGYFDPAHKKPIKRIPNIIGVVTSPTGAAVRDIINTVERRFPFCKIIVYPALVQGIEAKESIVEQIKKANEDGLCETLIVGRGGGSIEDLWAFNEKIVADAIYNSKIPIISAVGHEVDFTIADFVADKRAATPTAAAELATPNVDALKESILFYVKQATRSINNRIENYKVLLGNIDRHLDMNNPLVKLKQKGKELNDLSLRLNLAIKNILEMKRQQFNLYKEKLQALNPLAIMDKGYSIARNKDKIVKSVADVKKDDVITITLNDGILNTKVMEVKNNGKQ
ncbi:MAG: exodeoxyribonuclease VII large subunit [Anaeroplasmataceae bacterium]